MLSGQRNCCGLFHFTGTFELLPKAIWLVTLKWKQTFVTHPKTHSDYRIHCDQYNWDKKVRPTSFWICVLAFIWCMLVVLQRLDAAAPSWSQVMTTLLSHIQKCLLIMALSEKCIFAFNYLHIWMKMNKDALRIIQHFTESYDIQGKDDLIVF